MILIYSTAHEPAPLLDTELVEENAQREIRPIYKKMRKVRGKTGWFLRRYGWIFGAPKDDPEGVAHHALQIGSYVYEMTREKYLIGQRLTGHQVWQSTIAHKLIGFTDLSDEEIQMEAIKSESFVRSRNGGKYHIKHNNCQTFIVEMERRLHRHGVTVSFDNEAQLRKVPVPCYTVAEKRKSAPQVTCKPVELDVEVPTVTKPPMAMTTTITTIAQRRAEKVTPIAWSKAPLTVMTTVVPMVAPVA